MNKKKRKLILQLILLICVALFLYIRCMMNYHMLQNKYTTVSVQLSDDTVTVAKLNEILDEEEEKKSTHIPEITGYGVNSFAFVSLEDGSKKKRMALYQVKGSMMPIIPVLRTRGNYVYEDDDYGCIIDESTAYYLFGSLNVVGQSVTIEGEVYYIRGTIRTKFPTVMVVARSKKAKMNYLELSYGKKKQQREYTKELIYTYGLGEDSRIIDQKFMVDILGNALLVPVILLFILSIRYNHFSSTKQRVIVILSCLILLCVIVCKYGCIPLQYIPTKWSDFSKYNTVMASIKKHLEELSYAIPTVRLVLFKEACIQLIIMVGIVCFLVWHVYEYIRLNK